MTLLITLLVIVIAYKYATGSEGPGTIAQYAANAGFSGADLATAVAIAYAESSGNPEAVGDLTLGISVGLWQINLAAHPEYNIEDLKNPQYNADAAFAIYRAAGNSFSPWTTFRSGAYQNYSSADDNTGSSVEIGSY